MRFTQVAFLTIVLIIAGNAEAESRIFNESDKIKHLIGQLGNTGSAKRNEATENLIKLGKPAITFLIDTIRSSFDPEIVLRSRSIVNKIERNLVLKQIRFAFALKRAFIF